MKNIVEYLVKFKADQANVPSVARRVENSLDKVGRKADIVGSKISAAFSGKNFASALQGLPVIGSLMNPYLAAITAIGASVTAITKVGSEAEMTAVSFGKLVGNEKQAADTLKEIKQYANSTPYKTMELVESAKQMLSFGVSTEKTVDTLKRLGDISMGDTNRLQSLSLVYSQVASAGKLQGQDFLQFVNAGFNPLQELSEMTGKTMAELKEMMSAGQIGEKAVAAAIEHATSEGGKFYGMSEELANTVQGKWSTLMGKFEEGLTKLFDYLKPAINWLIDVVPPFFDEAISYISEWADWTKKYIVEFKPFLTLLSTAGKYVLKLASYIKGYLNFQLRIMLKTIGYVGNALAKLFGIKGEKTTTTAAQNTKKKTEETAKKNNGKKQYGNLFELAKNGGKGGKGANGKDANAIATGGTRNTTINMTIGKFFDTMQVTMMDATDTTELETIVVQSLNRALAIATSTDR